MSNAAICWNGREGGRDKKYPSISETVGDGVTHYLKRDIASRNLQNDWMGRDSRLNAISTVRINFTRCVDISFVIFSGMVVARRRQQQKSRQLDYWIEGKFDQC